MNTLDSIKDLLIQVKESGGYDEEKKIINLLSGDIKEYYKEDRKSRCEKKVKREAILNLAKELNIEIPGVKIECYEEDDLLTVGDEYENISGASIHDSVATTTSLMAEEETEFIPELFDEPSLEGKPLDPFQELFKKLGEQEETLDSGKEFDDEREGDEEWVEPKYVSEKFVSQPVYYDRKAFHLNALQFIHSFGYNSYKRHNLCVINENTIIYLSGNYIHVYDVPTGTFRFIRSSGGGGLGHCTKHPFKSLFAVGEKGIQPLILIYDYPSLKVLRVLRGGADEGYNYLCFSPNGKWLLSAASKPDSSLTVWNWNKERIVLKQSNIDKEIWKTGYNNYVFGGIITAGVEHITFWKLIRTFTGLKLMPTPGKWSDKLFCDIHAFCALPEDMVIASNINNNLYLWEEDTLTIEIHRRNNHSLHDESIVYLEFKEKYDEVFSVGLEGKYKVWDFTRIEHAMLKGEEHLEIQPTFQRRIKDETGIATPISFERVKPNDPDSEMYYMQDRQGSIWLVELAVKESLKESKRVFDAHDGPIADIAPSSAGCYVATIGRKGLLVYNAKTKKLIIKKKFCAIGSSLLWLPVDVDKTACLLLIGFNDGTMRLAVLFIRMSELCSEESGDGFINIIQAYKPHSDVITVLSYDPHRYHENIVLSGSNDRTIFISRLKKYKQEYLRVIPIGFVTLPTPVYCITWNKNKESFLATSLLGTIVEIQFPEDIPDPPSTSFEIKLPLRICNFKSVKSEVERNMAISRNMERQKKRILHEEKKKNYEIELVQKRKRKLEEMVSYLKIKRKEERKQLKEEKAVKLKEQEDAALNENALLSKWYQYNTDESDTDDESSVALIKKPLLSDISVSSHDSDQMSIELLRHVKKLLDKKKKKKGIVEVNEIKKAGLYQTFEEVLKEVIQKINEIKNMYAEENKYPNDNQYESDQAVKGGEKAYQEDRFEYIMAELIKMCEENVPFDDMEHLSEDEEVPPRHNPSGPVPIYFASYINDNCIWVSAGGFDAGYIYEYKLGFDEPYKCTPIIEFDNIEITCLFEEIGGYLIVGQGDGFVKVIAINPDNFSDFSNYWLYGMHDGRITKICATYDFRFLYSVGDDSNIFYYNINFINTKPKEKRNLPQMVLMPTDLNIEDYIPPEEHSLEQAIKKNEKNWLYENKPDIRIFLQEKLENLANKLEIILSLNEGLPESQKLPLDYFIINEEYHNKILANLVEKKNNETKEFENKFEKVNIIKNQIYNYFLNPIKIHKIYIYAHYFNGKVTTFYQSKLPVSYLVAEREVDDIMVDILKKGREKLEKSIALKTEQVVKKKYKKKDLEIRPFVSCEEKMLQNMSRFQKSIYTKIIKRRKRRKLLKNLLRIFKHQRGEKKVDFSRQMLYNKIYPRDRTFRLKCDPLYKTTENLTKERKYYQLVTTKRKIYNLKSHFNNLILRAREIKSKASSLSNSCHSDLKFMEGEFKNVIWPTLPQKVDIFEPLEFPEKIYMDEPATFPHDEEIIYGSKNALFHQLYEINKPFPIDITNIECGVSGGETSKEYTQWEMEFIFERKQILLSDCLKKKTLMEEFLEKYDQEVNKLSFMKVEYEIKIAYLKICYLKYFEELQVTKIFQLLEDDVENKCSVFIRQKHINILRIKIREGKIKKCTFDIVKCFHKCQLIASKFLDEIRYNPPAIKRFVMKYFNRTWASELKKQEQGSSDEDAQQEEQLSSSSDEDSEPPEPPEEEIDSDDIDMLVAEQQEDFIEVTKAEVEEQCGKALFEHTIETREKRYMHERKMAQLKENIKSYNEQIKELREKLLMIQTIIAIFKVKKSLIREEKQRQLNKIRTVVILDSSQMQHFDSSTYTFPPMRETILFPLYTLKKLEAKRRKLKNNMLTVDLDQKETLKHVQRLCMDIDYLKQKLKNIQDTIRTEKITKLGLDINLPKMEETILRRIIKDYKYDTLPFHMKFLTDIKKLQVELEQGERSAAEHIKQNTIKHLKYGALLEQKRQYYEIMKKIEDKKQVQYLSLKDVSCDIEKIKQVLEVQENIKNTIIHSINEIKSTKPAFQFNEMSKFDKKNTDDKFSETDEDSDSGKEKKKSMKKQKKKFKGIDTPGNINEPNEGFSGGIKREYLQKLKETYRIDDDMSSLEISSDDELKEGLSESGIDEVVDEDSYETAMSDK